MSDVEDLNPPWLPAAEAILQAAIDKDLARVAELMDTAVEEHGSAVPSGFPLAWIDALRQRIGVPVGARVHTHHRNGDTGQDVRVPPPGVLWASKLITARIARDQQAYHALIEEAWAGGRFADHLCELLLVVAETINAAANGPVARLRTAGSGGPRVAHTHGLGDVRPPV